MKVVPFLLLVLLVGCANSTTDVKHTVIVKGDQSASLAVGDSPSLLSITVEELYAGSNADCSDLQVIRRLKNGSGETTEIFSSTEPVVISARPENLSTIRCIAVRLSDIIVFTPNDQAVSNIGSCSDTSYEVDVFRAGAGPFSDVEGNTFGGSGNVGANDKQSIYLFFSTSGTTSQPTAGAQRSSMSSALETNAPYDIILYADYEDQVVDSGGNCYLNGFRLGLREGSTN